MSRPATLAELFRDEPPRWGFRGDPHLWREMAKEFEDVACPSTPAGVAALVEEAFARLTGRPISHPEPIFVPRYDHGGMSGGHVRPDWWRETGLPLLLDRHSALHSDPADPP
ncbi:MAG TPA: hypothetical protein VF746_15665 [Longimicrobium sp.]|jgi:molybdenum cofactor cytidylyltransferase